MADVQRHRTEDKKIRYFDVDSATVISIGDMVWLDTDDVKPASDFTWDTDLITTQKAFYENFVGIAMDRSRSGDTAKIAVAKNGNFEMDCASASFEVGDLLGPAKQSGNYLENQKVAAVVPANAAMGSCSQKTASETRVLVDIRTALDNYAPIETAADVKTALETLTGAARLDADYIKDGSTNKFVSHDNAAYIRTQLETLTLTDRLNADSVKDGSTNKFITFNGTKIYAIAHTVTSGEASANQADIDTSFAAAPDVFLVQILRSGVDVKEDAVVTALGSGDVGKIRVADGGATYSVTAGDVIHLLACKI